MSQNSFDKQNILKKDLRLEQFYQSAEDGEILSELQLSGRDRREKENCFDLGSDLEWAANAAELEIVGEEGNLVQAIFHRLRTAIGELTDTGHPYYGSEIYKMVGEPNTERTRDIIKLIVRDTLLQEARIKEIRGISVTPGLEPDYVDIEMLVVPLTQDNLIRLSTEYSVEAGKFR